MNTKNYRSEFLSKVFRVVLILTLFGAAQSVTAADFVVTGTGDSGAGTLRQAITDFNGGSLGTDRIIFNIPGSGVKTIVLNSPLPDVFGRGVIDGWSQGGTGYTGPPLIEVRGNSSNMCIGLKLVIHPIFGPTNLEVRGLTINGFGCADIESAGIYITSSNKTVSGCYIGTNANGSLPFPNKNGILVFSDNNTISGNTISGNTYYGILLGTSENLSADDNRIEGNYIGVRPSGTFPMGNGFRGIEIGGLNNVVGGTTPAQRNVISANGDPGIRINSEATNNRIEGNYIGLDAPGTGGYGNNGGITVLGSGNTIGGPGPERRNVISANSGPGIYVESSNNKIQGNYIGLNAAGDTALGNIYGIIISGGDNSLIGGPGSQFGNVISSNGIIGGNGGGGIKLQFALGTGSADNNTIIFNTINANAGGSGEGYGIWIENGNNNLIGGTVTLGDFTFNAGNTIAQNYAHGVRISQGTGNKMSRNLMFGNSDTLGGLINIDLDPIHFNANDNCDTDTGANNLQNYPGLASAVSANDTLIVTGSLNSERNKIYTVEFFSNTSCSSAGYGPGRTFLGARQISIPNGPGCSVGFQASFNIPTLPAGTVITATDPDGNTSEFSACRTVSSSSLQFSSATYSVAENGGSATITVTRTGGASGTASVNYSTTSGGTAAPGADYTPTSGTLNFATGETSKTFSVPILDDNFYEGNETVNLVLGNVTGNGTVLGSPDTAVLTITDNESQPTISINDVSQTEGNSGATNFTFTVSLTNASAQAVSVTYATADGTATTANNDYQAAGATLNFAPNETSKTFNVIVNGDTNGEPDETFFVNLTNPTNATISDNQGQGTILNDDPCINSINPTSINSSSGGGTGVVNVTSPCSWTAVSNAAWITVTGGASGTGNGTVSYTVASNSGTQRTGTITIAGQTFTVNQAGAAVNIRKPADFDGDGNSDLSIYRPSNGQWWYQRSSDNLTFAFQFGTSTDRITPGDYDGDGKTDCAFWRPSTGEWFVLRSSNLTYFSVPFGTSSDIPAQGNFDGDTMADFAVFRPANATWYISNSTGETTIIQFGLSGDLPVVGDYDGDGRSDVGIYRANGSNQEWWIRRSSDGNIFATVFGITGDKAVQADYTGDGKTDVAFRRGLTGEWFVLRSEDFSYYSSPFGTSNDIPAPGDFDGDGKADFSVFRPSDTNWYILRSSAGILIQQFGANGDIPVEAGYIPQ